MDETITFRVTISGTYTVPVAMLKEYYDTEDPQEAAQLDLVTFEDHAIEGVVAMEVVDTVTVKVEDES